MTAGLLALVEPAVPELRLGDPAPQDRPLRTLAGAHQRDRLRFPPQRRVRRPVPAVVETPRRVEAALLLEHGDRPFGGRHRHRAGIAAEGRRQEVGVPEHRLALREVRDGPARGVRRGRARRRGEVRGGARTLRLAGMRVDGFGGEPERPRLELPGLAQRDRVHVALGRPRHQGGARRKVRVLGRRAEAALGHRRLDHLAGDARDLEAPVRVRLLDRVAEVLQPAGELRPVDRADCHLLPVEAVVDHRPPFAVLALDHVGDHAMGMQLGIEVARSVVAESRGHHLLVTCADHRTRRLVLDPGPDGVLLDPGEGLPHRLVVRVHDPPVAAHHRYERDRLRRRERDVAAGAVPDLPVRPPAAELRPVRDPALEDPPEDIRIDRTREPERLGALAGPAAGLAVCRVVLRVVAVPLVVARTLRRRGDDADRGDHYRRPFRAASETHSCACMAPTYGLRGHRTSSRRVVSYW